VVRGIDLDEGELTVDFERREVRYGFAELDELVLAYATTIHKSQGSEYPAVVIPLTTQHSGSFGSPAENGVDCGLTAFGEVFEAFDRLETEAAKQRQRGVANRGEHLRGMAGVGSRLIFTATDIANVVQLVLDAPMIAG